LGARKSKYFEKLEKQVRGPSLALKVAHPIFQLIQIPYAF